MCDTLFRSISELWPQVVIDAPFTTAFEAGGELGGLEYLIAVLLRPSVKGVHPPARFMVTDIVNSEGARHLSTAAASTVEFSVDEADARTEELQGAMVRRPTVVMTLAGPQVVKVWTKSTGPARWYGITSDEVAGELAHAGSTGGPSNRGMALARSRSGVLIPNGWSESVTIDVELREDALPKTPRFVYNVRVAPITDDSAAPKTRPTYAARSPAGTPRVGGVKDAKAARPPAEEEVADSEVLSMKSARDSAREGSQGGGGARVREDPLTRDQMKAAGRKMVAKRLTTMDSNASSYVR